MKQRDRLKLIVAFLGVSLLFDTAAMEQATEQNAKAHSQPTITLKQEIQQELDAIKALIGTAHCDTQNQCDAIAIGHKACGGPQAYLTYSTREIDVKQLVELATKHRALNQRYNQLTGMMSDCMLVSKPVVTCQQTICISQ